jgi:uncharacterized membrane protein
MAGVAPGASVDRGMSEPGRAVRRGASAKGDLAGRASARIADFLGTPLFLLGMTVVIIVWVTANQVLPESRRFDAYPFMLLNLFFSLIASYSAPLIMYAQNREADRERVALGQDREQAAQEKRDMAFLTHQLATLRTRVDESLDRDALREELRDVRVELSRIRRVRVLRGDSH